METEEQLNVLSHYHCHEFQGYLYSPPVLPKDFERFLTNVNENELSSKKLINHESVKKPERNNESSSINVDQSQDKGLKPEILESGYPSSKGFIFHFFERNGCI